MLGQRNFVKRISLGCFLRIWKMRPVRKVSILLSFMKRITKAWTRLFCKKNHLWSAACAFKKWLNSKGQFSHWKDNESRRWCMDGIRTANSGVWNALSTNCATNKGSHQRLIHELAVLSCVKQVCYHKGRKIPISAKMQVYCEFKSRLCLVWMSFLTVYKCYKHESCLGPGLFVLWLKDTILETGRCCRFLWSMSIGKPSYS